MPKPKRIKYTDKTLMPWGEHKGVPMGEVPATYLLWLFKQHWIADWPDLYAYLRENQDILMQEEEEEAPPSTGGFNSVDDYFRYGRD